MPINISIVLHTNLGHIHSKPTQQCTSVSKDFAEILKFYDPYPVSQKGSIISEVFKQTAEHLACELSDYNGLYPELK